MRCESPKTQARNPSGKKKAGIYPLSNSTTTGVNSNPTAPDVNCDAAPTELINSVPVALSDPPSDLGTTVTKRRPFMFNNAAVDFTNVVHVPLDFNAFAGVDLFETLCRQSNPSVGIESQQALALH
jgi:hypothetical protein